MRSTLPGVDLGNNDYLSRWDLGSPDAPSHELQLTRTGLSQVVDVKVVLTRQGRPNTQPARIAECLVGDPTGVIIFTARNEQGDARRAHAAPVDVHVTYAVKWFLPLRSRTVRVHPGAGSFLGAGGHG